jgi:hypothetical protein
VPYNQHLTDKPVTFRREFHHDRGRYSDIADTERARSLWDFITSRDTIVRMTEASDRGKPAVLALGSREMMVKRFGEEVTGDRWKQMIGAMVRQVMEESGPFEIAAQGIKIGGDTMFSKGTRYRRRAPRWGVVYVEGHRRGGPGVLYGDLGADTVDDALAEIEGFLRACRLEEIPTARIEIREVGASPSRSPTRTVPINVPRGNDEMKPIIEQFRKALPSTPPPRVDFEVTFSRDKRRA